jgi:hypothetical protein
VTFAGFLYSYSSCFSADVHLRRDQGALESIGKVVYTHANFGMGVAFIDVTPDQRSTLESWIAEIVSK